MNGKLTILLEYGPHKHEARVVVSDCILADDEIDIALNGLVDSANAEIDKAVKRGWVDKAPRKIERMPTMSMQGAIARLRPVLVIGPQPEGEPHC